MLVLIWLACLLAALALYLRKVYSRFANTEVNHLFYVPVLGHMYKNLLQLEHMADALTKSYNAFPDDKFVGFYQMMLPTIIIRDTETLKRITVKDFDHFVDHRSLGDDPLFGRHLFSLRGQEWKDMRSTLSPAFTSSKIKLMLPFMVEVGDQMIKALMRKIGAGGVGYLDVETRDLATRYANDVIASCAFGLKIDSMTEEKNNFYVMGKKTTNLSFYQIVKMFAALSFPKLFKTLKLSLFPEETKYFFKHLVNSTMKEREDHNIIRPDMIHLLMEAKKGNLSHESKAVDEDAGFATVEESNVGRSKINRVWADDDLVAQAFLFFFAGFDTVSTSMTFLLHEMALNPDVQEKLYAEIKEHDAKNGGRFDYSSIQQMQYMDMVVSELLRLWSPGVGVDRLCTRDYNLGRPNSKATKDYIIRKGEALFIPIWSIHRNPDFFPDPERFDPERFSDENKHKIKPFTYVPFGLGPRNCIGSRFALCEVKVMVYQLLKEMEVSPCEKTCIPTRLEYNTFNLRMKGGHWLRFTARNKA